MLYRIFSTPIFTDHKIIEYAAANDLKLVVVIPNDKSPIPKSIVVPASKLLSGDLYRQAYEEQGVRYEGGNLTAWFLEIEAESWHYIHLMLIVGRTGIVKEVL